MAGSSGDIYQVKRQMNQPQIHVTWERNYRSLGNERFFERIYDEFVKQIGYPLGSHALDIGCGVCANSIRLARRGNIVSAADYSEAILDQARANVSRNQLSEQITIDREDILNLSFPDNRFDLVLCWGVLMHIPDAERAISQLIRVQARRVHCFGGSQSKRARGSDDAPGLDGTQKRCYRHEYSEGLRTD